MATYVIGDLQGCHRTLLALLDKLHFDPTRDRLWFAGDLVNRGPGSLECLRLVRSLGEAAVCVLGNHDLHLLAVAHGIRPRGAFDSLQDVLEAPDRDALLDWLRQQPLLHQQGSLTMVHAAISPAWNPAQVRVAASEIETELRGPRFLDLLRNMYGDTPAVWDVRLGPEERRRYIINVLTRARCFDAEGSMDLRFKGPPELLPGRSRPWYESLHDAWKGHTVLAGHWSAAGIRQGSGYVTLDSGCVWGGALTAYFLEAGAFTSVLCAAGDRASSNE